MRRSSHVSENLANEVPFPSFPEISLNVGIRQNLAILKSKVRRSAIPISFANPSTQLECCFNRLRKFLKQRPGKSIEEGWATNPHPPLIIFQRVSYPDTNKQSPCAQDDELEIHDVMAEFFSPRFIATVRS